MGTLAKLLQIDRDTLYNEVWSTPMTQLGVKYGVTGPDVKKRCIELQIPCPRAGYWSRLRHGYPPEKPPLPPLQIVSKPVGLPSKIGRPRGKRQSSIERVPTGLLTIPNTRDSVQLDGKPGKRKASVNTGAGATEGEERSLSRERLYELVWAEPMIKIAARYGVSSSYLARVCASLLVPRPARGYWAKLAVGIQPKVPLLPEVRPGGEQSWNRGSHDVSPDLPLQPSVAASQPEASARRKAATRRSVQHGLIRGAKELFEAGRVSSYSDPKYLKPAKKLLVDLTVTKTCLDRALAFANQLFLELEGHGHHVVIAPHGQILHRELIEERENPPKREHGYHHQDFWSPLRCTVVYVGTVAIGLTVFEMSESAQAHYVAGEYIRESEYIAPKRKDGSDHTWTTTRDFATERLCLQAYSPYPGAKWVRQWKEVKGTKLSTQISAIIQELELSAVEVTRLVAEADVRAEAQRRQWEIDYQKYLQAEAERRATAALKESKEDLLQFIARWAKARDIERFLSEVEADVRDLDSAIRQPLLDRLQAARALFDEGSALEHLKRWRTPQERLVD